MVEEIKLDSWERFEETLNNVRISTRQSGLQSLLFRGQSNSKWLLHTTLERWVDRTSRKGPLIMPVEDYYNIISSVRPEIETFTGTNWIIPPQYRAITKEMDQLAQNYDMVSLGLTFGTTPGYEYMAYLRHHGFPSPLLDWTRSPYIAAYFAFSKIVDDEESVSIYMLSEGEFTSGSSNSGRIYRLGPNVKVHRRHVLQQSEYTMALYFTDDTGWWIIGHDDVLVISDSIGETPWNFKLTKFVIPSGERTKVLALLDEHNLNAFSLFGSEESLMETIA